MSGASGSVLTIDYATIKNTLKRVALLTQLQLLPLLPHRGLLQRRGRDRHRIRAREQIVTSDQD
jgi:hypothetical protein